MTIEQALEQLNLGPGINEDVSEEYNEATDMAIKALEFIAQSVKSDVDMAKVADAIEALEKKQETGWWINEKCPRCGCRSMLGLCLEHFCPNCGLKMEYKRRRIKYDKSN